MKNKRNLGNSGLEVAPLAFGCNVFGWTVDEHDAYKLLDEFVASGFNLIDTADIYGKRGPQHQGGLSESIIGNWLQGSKNRSKVIIATKVGMEIGPEKKGLSKIYILQAVGESRFIGKGARLLYKKCRPQNVLGIGLESPRASPRLSVMRFIEWSVPAFSE